MKNAPALTARLMDAIFPDPSRQKQHHHVDISESRLEVELIRGVGWEQAHTATNRTDRRGASGRPPYRGLAGDLAYEVLQPAKD